jgi:hypothetical protein
MYRHDCVGNLKMCVNRRALTSTGIGMGEEKWIKSGDVGWTTTSHAFLGGAAFCQTLNHIFCIVKLVQITKENGFLV